MRGKKQTKMFINLVVVAIVQLTDEVWYLQAVYPAAPAANEPAMTFKRKAKAIISVLMLFIMRASCGHKPRPIHRKCL